MDHDQLREKFPKIRPIKSPPTLFTINGCGLTINGSRDHDPETRTYVATWCLSLVFVPLLALGAYRVANAERGWYFLGKEPLSAFAKYWNLFLALVVASAIVIPQYQAYYTSPEYLAKQQLIKATAELAEGKVTASVKDYVAVVDSATTSVPAAQAALRSIVTTRLRSAPLADASTALRSVVHVEKTLRTAIADDATLLTLGKELAAHDEDPRPALGALDAITPLLPPEEKLALREPLLVKLVAKEPSNLEPLSDLVEIYEARGEGDRCEALLIPRRAQLGTTEGARILGRIDASKGRNEESYQLLFPYCRDRLKTFQELERGCHAQEQLSYKAAFAALNAGAAGPAWHREYEAKSDSEKQEFAQAWAIAYVKKDKRIAGAYAALRKAAVVVPVALDLGVVTLQRAQSMADPAARKAEFESAEKTFLAIKGVAGDDDDFRLSYGQVCYWLGKQDEGKKEFDSLLEKQHRANLLLLKISQIMRYVGAMDEARTLAEEAYGKAKDQQERNAAAYLRSMSFKDIEDSIRWLEKCDQTDKWIVCGLNYSRGVKALNEGDNVRAIAALRDSIAGYEAMPKSAATLNNGALAAYMLFDITGDFKDLERGNRWLEEAIALEPGESILIGNLAYRLVAAGIMEVIGKRIDQPTLRMSGNRKLLGYCYHDEAGKALLAKEFLANASIIRALAYYDKLLVISPKDPGVYSVLQSIYLFTDNTAGLRALQQRLLAAQVDASRERQEIDDIIAGKNDGKFQKPITSRCLVLDGLIVKNTVKKDSLSYAVAACELVENRLAGEIFGEKINHNELVTLAEQSEKAAPSAATRSGVIAALFSRAVRRTAGTTPAVAALIAKYQRVMSTSQILVVACMDPKLRQLFSADPDIKRAIGLCKAQEAAFPHRPDILHWALLNTFNDPGAVAYAEALTNDVMGDTDSQMDLSLNALSTSNVLDAWWRHGARGDKAGAEAILATARERGVLLPDLVP